MTSPFTAKTAEEIRAIVDADKKLLPQALTYLALRVQRPDRAPRPASLDLFAELAGQPRKPVGADAATFKAWRDSTVKFAATVATRTPEAPKARATSSAKPSRAKGGSRKTTAKPSGVSADVAALAKQVEALTALVTALAAPKAARK